MMASGDQEEYSVLDLRHPIWKGTPEHDRLLAEDRKEEQ